MMPENLLKRVKQFCSQGGIRLNTNLGQHYLVDQSILEQIVAAGNIQSSDHIVEIGPGIGVLTKELLERANTVNAIEIDEAVLSTLALYTAENGCPHPNLTVINQNALKTDLPQEPYKMIANIPYHITSPLLRHVFLESPTHPTSLTLLIQREVAEKICDQKSAGMLTVLVALFGKAEIICHVPPSAFLPPPKVDSSVIHIDVFSQPIADKKTIEQIFKLTKIAFSQKRKMLRKTIGSLPSGMDLLEKAGIDPTLRPQALTIENWHTLATVWSLV